MIRMALLSFCLIVGGVTAPSSPQKITHETQEDHIASYKGASHGAFSESFTHTPKDALSRRTEHKTETARSFALGKRPQNTSWLSPAQKALVAPLNGLHTVATYIASPTKLLSLFMFSSFLSHGFGYTPSNTENPGPQFLTFRYDKKVSLSCDDIDDKPWCDYNIGFSRTDDVDILLRTLTTRDIERSMNLCKSHGCAHMELDTYKGGPSILHCSCCDSHHDVLSVLLPETSSSQTLPLL